MKSVHDNNIYALSIDFENSSIILHTIYDEQEKVEFTDIQFTGVLTHFFNNMQEGNIILDIEECEPNKFYEFAEIPVSSYCKKIKDEKTPSLSGFIKYIEKENLKTYAIASSYGLKGWVIAKDVKCIKRQEKYKSI